MGPPRAPAGLVRSATAGGWSGVGPVRSNTAGGWSGLEISVLVSAAPSGCFCNPQKETPQSNRLLSSSTPTLLTRRVFDLASCLASPRAGGIHPIPRQGKRLSHLWRCKCHGTGVMAQVSGRTCQSANAMAQVSGHRCQGTGVRAQREGASTDVRVCT